MNEFIKVLIERLEEEPYEKDGGELFLNGNMEDCIPLRKVEEIVNQLAEEHNNGWISVEERLPEKYGDYLCDTNTPYGRAIQIARFDKHGFWLNVIAWQPLPAPYQPKGE